MRQLVRSLISRAGYEVSRKTGLDRVFPEADAVDLRRLEEIRAFTMTSQERLWALRQAVKYVVSRKLPGAFVECGVWRGGSSMLAARTFVDLGDTSRELWLYDTYEGMPTPTEADKRIDTGEVARDKFEKARTGEDSSTWCEASLEDVTENLAATGYPSERIRYIIGKTQDTLADPANRPAAISLLRLDTDWYESTSAELNALFDQVTPGGVVIFDDYGHWAGAKQAVDEFFAARGNPYLLNRIDYSGRMMVKN